MALPFLHNLCVVIFGAIRDVPEFHGLILSVLISALPCSRCLLKTLASAALSFEDENRLLQKEAKTPIILENPLRLMSFYKEIDEILSSSALCGRRVIVRRCCDGPQCTEY